MALLVLDKAPSTLGKGTLGRHLVIRVAVIVAVTSVLLSAVAFASVTAFLTQRVDDELSQIVGRSGRDPGRPGGTNNRGPAGLPVGGILLQVDSQTNTAQCVMLNDYNSLVNCAEGDVKELADATGTKRRNVTISLTGGRYRVAVTQTSAGPQVVAIPLSSLDRIASQMLGALLLSTLAAVAAAVVVTRFVVARTVRPLHDVANVATEVSRRELDRGEVDLGLRVPATSTNTGTEVGRVGSALNYMLDNVESALASRQASEMKVRQFVADASHELRNPLAAIRGYAELTRRGRADLPPDTQFAMSRIESESERMSKLVEDLLLLARLDNGPALSLADVDLTDVVVNAVSDAQVAGPDHDWSVDVPEADVLVAGDRFRLHQVVANLLANARTHTPAGTSVTASVAVDGIFGVVTVTDDGPGIAPEILPRVFERFVRADAARARKAEGQSTGLGLSIVAAVVAAHGGRVAVESVPGRTQFTVRLPLAT